MYAKFLFKNKYLLKLKKVDSKKNPLSSPLLGFKHVIHAASAAVLEQIDLY